MTLGSSYYNKMYKQQNKDKIRQQDNIYRNLHKQEIKHRDKQYYLKNKAIIEQKHTLYNEKNKDAIRQYKKSKHLCRCGELYTTAHKTRHMATMRHQLYEQNKLFYTIRNGLTLIKQLDQYFS